MKKILAVLLTTGALASASFAGGLTQLELAELLVTKASAENLIEQKDYTDEEVMEIVANYGLMEITDASAEVDISEVRTVLGDYETKKLTIKPDAFTESEKVAMVEEDAHETLLNQERKLSHEFMKITYEERNFTDELGRFEPLDGESFVTTDDDVYPLMNKYRYELYRIFGWYAKEYNLYVHQTPASVGLYADKASVVSQSTPLIKVGFMPDGFTLSDGIYYSVRMQTGHLYSVKYEGETLAEAREKVIATGFKQDHLVLALKDAVSLFIQDEVELNKYVDTYVADVVENEDKVYSYDKKRYEIFDGYKVFIIKCTGSVFYHIDYDLTKWGTK